MKFLLFILAAVVVYMIFVAAARKRVAKKPPPASAPVEAMVPCAHCGVNLPRSEALETGGRFFCSEEHRRLAAR